MPQVVSVLVSFDHLDLEKVLMWYGSTIVRLVILIDAAQPGGYQLRDPPYSRGVVA